ncbi:M48 family metalloprotease [candidate division KSB1 bacterium]|nr:M48 family metalloprotease [candidate division KSB1 bacterium]
MSEHSIISPSINFVQVANRNPKKNFTKLPKFSKVTAEEKSHTKEDTVGHKKFLRGKTLFSFFILLLFVAACATNPVTGKKELSLLSTSDEIRLGEEADKSIVAQYGLYDDPELAKFVEDLGHRMAKISHRPDLPWHFRVLDSPVVNAFALPGGYTYVTRGILSYMNSEAELAGVMGHEIGHVTARHGAKAYTRAQLAQVGLTAGYVFSETFREFSDIAQVGVGLLFLKFSRDQERQSDELGVQYSTAVGYDATYMSNFFGTLDRLQEESGQSLPGWLSTHPNPEDRQEKILQLAKQAQQDAQLSSFDRNRDSYLRRIDGIVFGEDPRQGFVENGFFYHPQMDFQFPVPTDWQLVNSPSQVQMVSKEQNAGIQFTLSQQPDARSAAEQFMTNSQAQLIASDYTTVNNFTTEIRESRLSTQQGQLQVLSYFIEKGDRVFVFHGFASPGDYRQYVSTFKYTMSHFDRLKNEQARNKQPTRLKIATVRRSSTLQEFLAQHPTEKIDESKLAIINGIELTDTVQPGDKIKVLSE